MGCDAGDWIALAQDRVQWWAYVWAVLNLRVPQGYPQVKFKGNPKKNAIFGFCCDK